MTILINVSVYAQVYRNINNFHVRHDVLNAKPQSENDPNRDPVLRDQKVFPEVPNQQLLPRFCFRPSNLRKSVLNSLWVKRESVPHVNPHSQPPNQILFWSYRYFQVQIVPKASHQVIYTCNRYLALPRLRFSTVNGT